MAEKGVQIYTPSTNGHEAEAEALVDTETASGHALQRCLAPNGCVTPRS